MSPIVEYLAARSEVRFWCSGCQREHYVCTHEVGWNHDTRRPTFDQMIRVHGPGDTKCECSITYGVAHYTLETTHRLAGRLVPLEDLPV